MLCQLQDTNANRIIDEIAVVPRVTRYVSRKTSGIIAVHTHLAGEELE